MKEFIVFYTNIKNLLQALRLIAKNNCFETIQSILVNTNIEKPPNVFLADY